MQPPSEPWDLNDVRAALGDTPTEFARRLRVSRRTVQRWKGRVGHLTDTHKRELARDIGVGHPQIALHLAQLAGLTPDAVGLERSAVPRVCPPTHVLVDSVVCAAVDAAALAPVSVRAALLAAVQRCREAGVTLEELEETLRLRAAAP